jgi:hypothetical protein
MGRSRKNAKGPSRDKRLRDASKETAAKQQYPAIHLDVGECENARASFGSICSGT